MDFFDISMLTQRFVIDGDEYKVLLQMCISPLRNTVDRVLVLSSIVDAKKIRIIAWDEKKKRMLPISHEDVKIVVCAIQKMQFDEKLQERIKGLHVADHIGDVFPHFESLSDGIEILISEGTESALYVPRNIELEFDQVKLRPVSFVYGAFDGLRMNVCFELEVCQLALLKNWGLLTPIRIYADGSLFEECYAQKTNLVEGRMLFDCEPQMLSVLGRRETGWMRIENINPIDLSDFLISTAGFYDKVVFPEGTPSTPQWYNVVMPVEGLVFKKDFGIGNVQFCTVCSDELVHICEYSPNLSEYDAFAVVNVNSDTLYHAFARAKKQIEQAVDLLVNILKDDSLYSIHALGDQIQSRNNNTFEPKVSIPPWVCIEIPFTGGRLVCDYAEIVKQEKLSVPESFEELKDELNRIELLLLKANGRNDKELTPLFNALKWVRRAWDAEDFDDKIIYSIIALEFIVSKEPNVPMMGKSLRKKCKGEIRKVISFTNDPSIEDRLLYSQQVCEKFDRTYTETPFLGKLRNLINRLNIPVSDAEMELIVKCRKQRNEIVHGENDLKLPTDEIFRLCECIGRIAFYKLASLED